jgi:hypothetical protein
MAAERALYGARLILVRPDQFVAWASDRLEGDALEILERATGIVLESTPPERETSGLVSTD